MFKKIRYIFPIYALLSESPFASALPEPQSLEDKAPRMVPSQSVSDMGWRVKESEAQALVERYPFLAKLATYKHVAGSTSLYEAFANAWGHGSKVPPKDRRACMYKILSESPSLVSWILKKFENRRDVDVKMAIDLCFGRADLSGGASRIVMAFAERIEAVCASLIEEPQANYGLMPAGALQNLLEFRENPEEWFTENYILPVHRERVASEIGTLLMSTYLGAVGRKIDFTLQTYQFFDPEYRNSSRLRQEDLEARRVAVLATQREELLTKQLEEAQEKLDQIYGYASFLTKGNVPKKHHRSFSNSPDPGSPVHKCENFCSRESAV